MPPTPTGPDARPVGRVPYAEPGTAFCGRYRYPAWQPGAPEHVFPMRIVRDNADGVVGWLAPATPRLELRDPDGAGPRDVPLDRRFRPERHARAVSARVSWRGPGVLRLMPAGRAWSVLFFWAESAAGDLDFAGWYVNLESPGHREGHDVVSIDHVLDVWIEPDGAVSWKDEDELAAAVDQGRYTAEQADVIRRSGDDAIDEFRSGSWVFDELWTRWRAPSDWTIPDIPDGLTWTLDLLDA